ncbi:DEKNAAC102870 [Brettanomyces naardenensis]|uniref:Large ribosomal subunit protein uL23m n=1 Tax=Brettanomyces naardenensis TaxID=13370 RepID=A0A448YLR5_BRENA|nr:DEKNAAC102870 [Brettanomyces naardenensis]
MLARLTSSGSSLFGGVTSVAKRTIIIGRWKPFPQRKKPESDRSKRTLKSKKIVEFVRDAIDSDEPNFKVGAREIYFPSARVCLLRPNAKHTPYQAKFIVPKSFNKLDLRDYLWHIYNLRVLNITSTLTAATFDRSLPIPYRTRYRSPQVKKMTVDLIDPFVWPAESADFKAEKELVDDLKIFREDKQTAIGSDKKKPTEAFGGILDPEPRAMNFIAKGIRRQMRNSKRRDISEKKKLDAEKFIDQYIPLQ